MLHPQGFGRNNPMGRLYKTSSGCNSAVGDGVVGPGDSRMTGETEAMKGLVRSSALFLVVAAGMLAGRARAQAPTLDTSVPGLPGGPNSLLGQPPGAGGGSFGNLPGTGGILGGRAGVSAPKGIPTSTTTPGAGEGPTALQMPVSAPAAQPVGPASTPLYGTLESPPLPKTMGRPTA